MEQGIKQSDSDFHNFVDCVGSCFWRKDCFDIWLEYELQYETGNRKK